MQKGGKQPGAGRPKGSTVKVASAETRLLFKPLMDDLTRQFLNHKDRKVRQRAWEVMVPYIYQRMPQTTELTGAEREPIQIQVVHVATSDQSDTAV